MADSVAVGAVKKIISVLRDTDMDVYDKFMIEMNALGILTIKGCREINEYNTENIIVVCNEFFINIKGENLQINHYSSAETEISGNIDNLSFIKR